MWESLTVQGKLATVAVLMGAFLLIGLFLAERDERATPSPTGTAAAALRAVTPPTPTPTTVIPISQLSPEASPGATPVASSTIAPLPTGPSPLPSPTAVPATALLSTFSPCVVQALVITPDPTEGATVHARLVCGDLTVADAPMTALFYYGAAFARCDGVVGAAGVASCNSGITDTAGRLVSVTACFDYREQLYCGPASIEP